MNLSDIEINANALSATSSEREEILQCLRTLLLTPAGTIPLYRDFGLNSNFLDAPMAVASNLLAIEIMDKVAKYEPRVAVSEVQCTAGPINGSLIVKVVITDG